MKEQAIKFFDLYTKDYDMILTGDLRKQNMFFCKFIRNTNKLDILYSMGIAPSIKPNDDGDIFGKVKDCFFNRKTTDYKDIKTVDDEFISTLRLIFDLNFRKLFQFLKENSIYDKIYETVNNKEMFEPYFEETHNYIEERMKLC